MGLIHSMLAQPMVCVVTATVNRIITIEQVDNVIYIFVAVSDQMMLLLLLLMVIVLIEGVIAVTGILFVAGQINRRPEHQITFFCKS